MQCTFNGSRQQAFLCLLVSVRPGAEFLAGAAAIVVAAGCVFVPTAGSAVGVAALTAAVSAHSPGFAGGADDPAPAWSGVSGAH